LSTNSVSVRSLCVSMARQGGTQRRRKSTASYLCGGVSRDCSALISGPQVQFVSEISAEYGENQKVKWRSAMLKGSGSLDILIFRKVGIAGSGTRYFLHNNARLPGRRSNPSPTKLT
jgi:hypothetical protein